MHSLRYRFKAIFGIDKTRAFDDLDKVLGELRTAVAMLGYFWYRRTQEFLPITEEEVNKLNETIKKYEAVFWEGAASPDSINEKIKLMISEIEKICWKILGKEDKGIFRLTKN